MGSPRQPTKEQIQELEKAGQLQQTAAKTSKVNNGLLQMNIPLQRQGIFFYKIQW
jgi:xylan 1,4-beta-xylosidase